MIKARITLQTLLPKITATVILIACAFLINLSFSKPSQAWYPVCCPCSVTCVPYIQECDTQACECQSNEDTPDTITHITDQFVLQREWIIKVVWEANLLPAMMMMTEQLSAVMIQQMLIVGSFVDAKHQLETQRLLQELQAQAHKDYQPSDGMCRFGTNTRSLAASNRNAEVTRIALSTHATQRQLLSGDSLASGSARDYARSRLAQFRTKYCNPADFGNGMNRLCSSAGSAQINRDINYTNTIEQPNTLEIDFTIGAVTPDEEDIIALGNNLYGSDIMPRIPEDKMATATGTIIPKGAHPYMATRAMAAHKSLTASAYATKVARKSQGTSNVEPFMRAFLEDMGLNAADVTTLLGPRPSYNAQMEFLTKTLYQTPKYYSELYDKPVNVDRKITAQNAIDLMQRRDAYRDSIVTKAILSGYLDNLVIETEESYEALKEKTEAENKVLNIPALN